MKNKTRFTSLDVRYAVWELSETVEGAYLQNVYDVKNKTYLFKFSRRDQQKTLVLVEAGTRIHATAFDRANPNVLPSGFITRLRKYIRDRRVTKLNQVAYDRVIHFEFGHETRPDSVFNLYVELFASGNLILTDYLNKVLVLSRKVQDRKNNDLILDVGFHYDPYNSNPLAPPSTANAIALLCPYFTPLEIEYLNSRKIIIPQDLEKIKTILENSKFDSKLSNSNVAISQSSLKNILKSEFPSPLCEQILIWAEIPLDCKITSLSTFFSALIEQCDSVVNSIVNGSREDSIGGYILLKDDGSFAEFHPFPFSLYSKSQYQHFKTFCESVDSFYHKLEELATTKAETVRTDLYQKKFKAVQDEQLARMSYLSKQMEDHLLSARLIESNMDLVEQAIAVVRAGLDNEMRWDELEDLIIAEQKMGRRVAKIIAGLKLQKSLIVLDLDSESSLSDRNLNDSSNSKDRPNLEKIITIAQDLDLNKKICSKSSKEKHLTEVDIRLGGFANSKRQYELRRVAFDKLGRTQKAFDHAIKSAEAKLKSEAKLDRKQRPQNLISKRKPFWFEKFNWFISSDGFLVISGRDMHQNEHIVKNILRKGDAYLHADVIGASSVIVKAFHSISSNEVALMMNIPHRTLVEAGALSLCHSRAWEARIVTSAWWVHASQVSKSAPSGEYLSTGSFVIRGRKNYLPPSQLILGFGIMFVLDEEGTVKRRNARIERLTTLDTDNIPEDTVKYTVDSDSINDDDQVEVVNTEIIRVKQNNNGNRSKQQDSTNEVKKTSKINGKKKSAKDKKKALKYRDQDEEERQARMELLGSAAPTKTNFKFSKPKISSSQLVSKSSKPSSLDQVSDRNMAEDHPQSSLGEADKKSVLEVDHSNQKNISKISIGDGYICPSNVLKNQSIESDLGSDDEILGLNELSVVDSLTGSLSPEDVPINALCVAAPFVVTQHYRFRVKLLPGTLKRGAAAKTSMALMLSENKASMSVIERDLLKSIPDSELNMTMPGKVRIAASGVEISKVRKAFKK